MFELEFDSNARLLNLNNVGGVTGKGAVPSLYHNNVAVIQILATGDIVSAVSQITIRAIFSDRRSGEDTGSVRGNRVVDGDGHSSVLGLLSRQRQSGGIRNGLGDGGIVASAGSLNAVVFVD